MVDVEGIAGGTIEGQPQAASMQHGAPHAVVEEHFDLAVHAVLEPPGPRGPEHGACLGHLHIERQQAVSGRSVPECAVPSLAQLVRWPANACEWTEVLRVGDE